MGKDFPSRASRGFDNFMRDSGLDTMKPDPQVDEFEAQLSAPKAKFLQQASSNGWTADDALVVKRAEKIAAAFVQSRQAQGYNPAYASQSGEIFGVLKQMKEEMEN